MEDTISEMGREQIALTGSDPRSSEVSAMAEKMFGEMMATGAEHHTVIVLMSALIGYAIGNGARKGGISLDDVRDAITAPTSAMIFAALDAHKNGVDVETMQ